VEYVKLKGAVLADFDDELLPFPQAERRASEIIKMLVSLENPIKTTYRLNSRIG
jgi:hypothetical protein